MKKGDVYAHKESNTISFLLGEAFTELGFELHFIILQEGEEINLVPAEEFNRTYKPLHEKAKPEVLMDPLNRPFFHGDCRYYLTAGAISDKYIAVVLIDKLSFDAAKRILESCTGNSYHDADYEFPDIISVVTEMQAYSAHIAKLYENKILKELALNAGIGYQLVQKQKIEKAFPRQLSIWLEL